MVTSRGLPLDALKLIISIILEALWVCWALGDMLSIMESNSHFRKRSVAKEMTTFGCHVAAHVSESVNSY